MHRIARITFGLALLLASPAIAQRDTARSPTLDTGEFQMAKSPLEAVLLSAVIPGAGQLYLDQAWKLPIIYGIAGAFLYGVLKQNSRYQEAQDSVNNRFARHTPVDSFYAHGWENSREFYRDDRDKWWIYLGVTYIANLIDAYISSHLYDFDVSNPSPSNIESYYDPIDRRVGMRFILRF